MRPHEVLPRCALLGGGLAGVAAAVALAERRVPVVLFEQHGELGGRVRGWPDQLASGQLITMERGFHAFFRNYYNLRGLLRRVDPELALLRPLDDYPLLGPDGRVESFSGLPRGVPWNLFALLGRTRTLRLKDLPRIPPWPTLAMFAYDDTTTTAAFDQMSAKAFLDALDFPAAARQMLFDIFAHSFFNPEAQLSAAEMIRLFHIYFTGNPEGLVFDVLSVPFSRLWARFERYLRGLGVELRLGNAVEVLDFEGERPAVTVSGRREVFEQLIVATDVGGLAGLAARSDPAFGPVLRATDVAPTAAFAVWRLWLDRHVLPSRAPFAAVGGLGRLDNISVLERYQDEAREYWRGSVVELHAYALEPAVDVAALKAELLETLHTLYPETRDAAVVEDRWLMAADCPAFEPGSAARRPRTETTRPRVRLAGDFVKLPHPVALMEGAATSGFVAANQILAASGLPEHPLRFVPDRGVLSGAHGLLARLA